MRHEQEKGTLVEPSLNPEQIFHEAINLYGAAREASENNSPGAGAEWEALWSYINDAHNAYPGIDEVFAGESEMLEELADKGPTWLRVEVTQQLEKLQKKKK